MDYRQKIMMICYTLAGKNLPLSYHWKFAKKLRVYWARRILKYAGNEINIEKGAYFNGKCSIGDRSGIGHNCELHANGGAEIIIGNYVNMGPEVVIYTQNHAIKRTDIIMQKQGFDKAKNVVIEDDIWIGRRVIILPGVTIGRGSVLGAGAVVAKNVEPYSVVVGNPAYQIKSRKNKE
jgi:maltose O-acetyltransferase